jgi:hypothetical protein
MALMQLVTGDNQNIDKKSIYAFEYISSNIDSDKFVLPKYSELMEPLYLKVKQNDNINNFIGYKIIIGGNTVLEIDYNFIKQLLDEPYYYKNGYMVYKLGFMEFFQHEIIHIATQFHNIEFQPIFINKNNIEEIQLVSKCIFLDNDERKHLAQNPQSKHIFQLQSTKINNIQNNFIKINIEHSLCTNGFFIETNNIDNIKKLNILLNYHNFRLFDDIDIQLLTKKINENLFYIPLSNSYNWFDKNLNGALNMSKIDSITFDINFSNIPEFFNIYNITHNELRYMGGLAGIKYISGSLNNNFSIDKNNNNVVVKTNYFDKFIITNKICNKPECRISLEQINENDKYFECLDCNNCYGEEIMKLWLTENKICPMCRKYWNNFNIYINYNIK